MQLWEIRGGRLYQGDVIEVLKQLPDNSVDVIITSPPYWAKRDYGPSNNRVWGGVPNCEHEWTTVEGAPTKLFRDGHDDPKYRPINTMAVTPGMVCRKCGAWYGQLGLEPTPQMFVQHLTEIFDEAKRVLKPTGSLFVNIDDTWLGSGSGNDTPKPSTTPHLGRRKSLALVPELFATSMVYEHGWILREKIIWTKKVYFYKEGRQKGNAMPEPVRDRFTHSWEYIFHFTRKPRYYFNIDAVKVPAKSKPKPVKHRSKRKSKFLSKKVTTRSPGARLMRILENGEEDKKVLIKEAIDNVNAYLKQKLEESGITLKELSKLTNIKETTLAHYFRTDTSGASIPSRDAWNSMKPILNLDDYDTHVKETYKSVLPQFGKGTNPADTVFITLKPFRGAHFAVFPPELPEVLIKAACPEGGTVLDPFAGSGTTLVVAERLGRKWVGIEINPEYCAIIRRRLDIGQRSLEGYI